MRDRMSFCPACGNNIDGMKFCSKCGRKIIRKKRPPQSGSSHQLPGNGNGFVAKMKDFSNRSVEQYYAQRNSPERLQKIKIKSEKQAERKRLAQDKKAQVRKAGLFHKGVHCPKCRSLNVQFMQNKKRGFSIGKAVGGTILTKGLVIGSLAGFAGKRGKKNQWHCMNCGKTFFSKK